jgi:streptogramin lyase
LIIRATRRPEVTVAMDRRGFQRTLLLTALTAPLTGALWGCRWDRPTTPGSAAPCHRTITEYELPPAEQTHEIIKMPGRPLVLVSQMSNSTLVKLWLEQGTEQVTGVRAFPLGPPSAMLHGLAVSSRYPEKIWATHEAGNRLLLVDPGTDRLETPPKIVRTIDIPGGGKGPHYVGEYGDLLWVSLKSSNQVLAINHENPLRYWLYQAKPQPIFVARHPDTGEFYVSQDQSNEILRINADTKTTSRIEIPTARGTTPVGLVAGPAGLWVALLGTKEQGTGTFGRINNNGEITWFTLSSPEGRHAGLLHVAFDPPGAGQRPSAWLLASSIISPNSLDAIIRVTFDDTYTQLRSEEIAALPTQLCKAHRLLPLSNSVLATELTSATVAQLVAQRDCRWDRPTTPESGDPN